MGKAAVVGLISVRRPESADKRTGESTQLAGVGGIEPSTVDPTAGGDW